MSVYIMNNDTIRFAKSRMRESRKSGFCEGRTTARGASTRPMNRRLKEIGRLDALKCPTQIHNFATDDELK